MSEATALVFGEALWDLLPSGPVLGGAPLNFAYRLGTHGVSAALVTQVGDDELGERAAAQMRELGMPTDLVLRTSNLPTGTVEITFDEERNPSYVIVPDVAYDAIPWNESIAYAAAQADLVCFGTLAQRDERSRATLARIVDAFSGSTILVDINLRPKCHTETTIRWSVDRGTVLKLNNEELPVLGALYGLRERRMPEAAAELAERAGLDAVVVTLGKHGAVAAERGKAPVVSPGFAVEVDDPCGSGDAFAAAFVAARRDGVGTETALERANALGALVATQPGATQQVDSQAVDSLIHNGARVAPSESVLALD